MSLSQLEYFVAVSERGHVGRAAEALRIAQPAISRQIRSLEDELGARLFVRTARGMSLSEPGQIFLEHARAILAQVEAAKHAIRAAALPPCTVGVPGDRSAGPGGVARSAQPADPPQHADAASGRERQVRPWR